MSKIQPFRDQTPRDAYGAFEFRPRSKQAIKLAKHLHTAILATESRKRQRRKDDAERFKETVERFVGELLHAKAKKGGTGRFGRAMSERGFTRGVVSYENVRATREGLKALGYLLHTKGSPSYGIDFDDPDAKEQRKGEAAKFEATPQLVKL
jgi:hypothetical protein